jgi:hypothetical protein
MGRLRMKCAVSLGVCFMGLSAALPLGWSAGQGRGVTVIGSRRQLFVDDALIENRIGVNLQLHGPCPREIVMVCDKPWEGSETSYQRIICDGNIIRMYYVGGQDVSKEDGSELNEHAIVACVALSVDGIHWVRPDLGLVDFDGAIVSRDAESHWIEHPIPLFKPSKHNNIIWTQPHLDNFTPFKDANPACPPSERYKAVGYANPMRPGEPKALFACKSADGIHWARLGEKPVFTNREVKGLAFDSENNAFWDPAEKHYSCYIRGYHYANEGVASDIANGTPGIRDIRVATSTDFRTWTMPRIIEFEDSYAPTLYTNQIEPYYRDPELLVGFPTRYNDRVKEFSEASMDALPDPVSRRNRMKFNPRFGTVISDGLFMTSRDGYRFHLWDQAFIPPGPERHDTWAYHDDYQSLGLVETPAADPTASPELSFYVTEAAWVEPTRLRRYTMRIDGFVSLHAPRQPGEFVTKPLIFSGRRLTLNFATSGAGSVRVEMESEDGTPLPGFSRTDCDVLFGDTLDRAVTWHNRSDVSPLAGKPVRIRMFLSEADIYSLKFGD